jgi:hypothetical protein
MDCPHPIADPISDRAIDLERKQVAESATAKPSAGPAKVCEELDRYDIAVILLAAYEWGGYGHPSAAEAIAAAKRSAK